MKRVDRLPEQLFFTITKQGETFYLQSIDAMRPPGCPGETYPHDSIDWKPPLPRVNQ